MAISRMISRSLLNKDEFVDLTLSSRILYVYLLIEADDFGFNNNPKALCRANRCKLDDLKLLADKGFILELDDSIVLITHWFQNNRPRAARMSTKYLRLLSYLEVVNPGVYVLKYPTYNFSAICKSNDIEISDRFPLDDPNSPTTIIGFARKFLESSDGRTEKKKGQKRKLKVLTTNGGQVSAQYSAVEGSEEQSNIDKESREDIVGQEQVQRKLYGIFENVLLSPSELKKIRSIGKYGYIDKASSWFKTKDKGICKYSTIISWICKDIGPSVDIESLIENDDSPSKELSMTDEDLESLKKKLKNMAQA